MKSFAVRDLLWLTLFACVLVGWWVDHRRLSQSIASANAEIRSVRRSRHPCAKFIQELTQLLDAKDPKWERARYQESDYFVEKLLKLDREYLGESE